MPIVAWMVELRGRFQGRPVGIAVETSRGPLIHALLEHACVVFYPINPWSLRRFRETFAPSGAKDDLPDADLLREMLVKHRDRLRPWVPDDVETRTLRRLVEGRRKVVDLRTKLTQQLTAALKEYFPQALACAGDDLAAGSPVIFSSPGPRSRPCSGCARTRFASSTPLTIVAAILARSTSRVYSASVSESVRDHRVARAGFGRSEPGPPAAAGFVRQASADLRWKASG